MSFNRQDVGAFIPANAKGQLTREDLFKHFPELTHWMDAPTLVAFGGSRTGSDPDFGKAAEYLSGFIDKEKIHLITGGAPPVKLGLMSKIADSVTNLLAVSPQFFADMRGENSGINPRAINLITHDFYIRKVFMGLAADIGLFLPGGLGTLEEIIEWLIKATKSGKSAVWLNVNGFWNDTLSQIRELVDLGLIRDDGNKGKRDIGDYSVAPTAEIASGHIRRLFKKASNLVTKPEAVRERPGRSLQSYLQENPRFLSDQVERFAGLGNPRINILVSGNISPDSQLNRLNDVDLTVEFCHRAEKIGQEIARSGSVLVLSGGNDGLRQIMARAAITAGGKVIWVQKQNQKEPLKVSLYHTGDNEMTFYVSREFEKAMVVDLIAQANGVLPGGIHTMDRTFEVVTRKQTGFDSLRSFVFMFLGVEEKTRDELIKIERKPSNTFVLNIGGIWSSIERQIDKFQSAGFLGEGHYQLIQFMPDSTPTKDFVHAVVSEAKQASAVYDLLKVFRDCNPAPSYPAPTSIYLKPEI